MSKLKLAAGVSLVFFVGFLAGSLATGLYLKHRMERFKVGGPPPRERTAFLTKRLADELDLTDPQRTEIEKIVGESQEKMLALRRKYLPETKAIVDQSFMRIRGNLNDAQKEKLDRLKKKLKKWRARVYIPRGLTPKAVSQMLSEMKDRLQLTEAQASKIRPIIENGIEKQKKIFETYKSENLRRNAPLRKEIRKLERSVKAQLEQVLTQSQLEEYRKFAKEFGRLSSPHRSLPF